MRVALDATALTLSSGGLRRYTEQLSVALAREFPEDVYSLVGDRAFTPPLEHLANLRQGDLPHTRLECRWWLCGASLAMRRLRAQVFHGTNFEVPYLNLRPSVLTLHDLSPWRNAEWHSGAGRVRARTPWLLRLGIATMVVTPSAAVRQEAIQYFGLAPERVAAVPLGPVELPPASGTSSAPRPFFLYVGAVEPRKNLTLLLEAWRSVRGASAVELVVAGKRRADGPELAAEPGLRVLGEVADAHLAELYGAAVALVYPSHYEGFGLPVLEAMQCGAAVITSADPALCELGGGATLVARSARELEASMRALLTQPELAAEYRIRGRRRALDFSWRETARRTREVYGEALARFG